MARPKLLFGGEYEVRCEDFEYGDLGWFRAKYMTAHAREMEWLWEIIDPRFKRDDAVGITDWRLPDLVGASGGMDMKREGR